MSKKVVLTVLTALLMLALIAGCAPAAPAESVVKEVTVVVEKEGETVVEVVTATPVAEEDQPLKVFSAFATPIEEPWDGVIHEALQKAQEEGKIVYTYTDDIGYSGDMERVLREICENEKPDLIMGDGFGNEEAIRRVAADYPEIAFAFGSGMGPVEPNFSVFDNWIHEPVYMLGMFAGGLTETNKVGIVGAFPVPEVNRCVNAFIAGAKEVNPDVEFYITYINSWFDPAAAQEAAQAWIDNGADVIYGYTFGAHQAAIDNGMYTFGMMADQHDLAPEYVVSSAVWNMTPTVEYLIKQVESGAYTAQDLKDFSMYAKGGAILAPLYDLENTLPADLVEKVRVREDEIKQGLFRVDIDEATPELTQ